MTNFKNIPCGMQLSDCWVCWKLETRNGKTTKVPYQTNGHFAKSDDPATWTNVNAVIDACKNFSGIGYVFHMGIDYIAIDMDHCFKDGIILPEAKKWVDTFDSYTEISQSGEGLHIIVESDKQAILNVLRSTYNVETGIKRDKGELYIQKRYFAITGGVYESHKEINTVDTATVLSFLDALTGVKNETETKEAKKYVWEQSPQMPDEEVINRAANARNGFRFWELYDEAGVSGNSEGDQAIINMLAFYTQDIEQIKSILRESPRYREKFDRDDYLDRSIKKAFDGLKATYTPKYYSKKAPVWDKKHVHVNSKGIESPMMSLSNLRILCKHEGINIKLNEMSHELELNGEKIEDRHDVTIKDITQQYKFKNAGIEAVSKYMDALGHEDRYHPVQEYLDALPPVTGYTEFERLCNTITLENPDDRDYADMLLKKWLISCVAAIYKFDFKSQGALTFQGEGGIFKSTWFSKLFPCKSWFKGEFVGLDVHDKDKIAKATKYWVVELAELESTMKKDFTALKGFITDEFDEYRAAYDRRTKKYKRRTVFCASVNPKEFIKDDTGDRRFWAIEVKALDTSTRIDLARLWSEIKSMYIAGEIYYLTREETKTVISHNREYSIKSSLDDAIAELIDPTAEEKEYTAQDMVALLRANSYFGDVTTTKISRALAKIGYKNKVTKKSGVLLRLYRLKLKPQDRF